MSATEIICSCKHAMNGQLITISTMKKEKPELKRFLNDLMSFPLASDGIFFLYIGKLMLAYYL